VGGVQREVAAQSLVGEHRRQGGQPLLGTVRPPHGDGPVHRHGRRGRDALQRGVQPCDRPPLDGVAVRRDRVQQRDRRLQLVGAGLLGAGPGEQALGLLERGRVPQRPVLIVEGDQSAGAVLPGLAASAVQQHQREQPGGLGVARHEPVQLPAEPDGLVAQLEPDRRAAFRWPGSPR
jgi:hypothetical protein